MQTNDDRTIYKKKVKFKKIQWNIEKIVSNQTFMNEYILALNNPYWVDMLLNEWIKPNLIRYIILYFYSVVLIMSWPQTIRNNEDLIQNWLTVL